MPSRSPSSRRFAAPPSATLLLIEQLVPDDPGPDWAKLLGGRQRTRREYEALLAAADFRLTREIDTRAGIAILEATAI